MDMRQLLDEADEIYRYPGELVIEKFIPGADALTDRVCLGVLIAEQAASEGTIGLDKENAVIGLVVSTAQMLIPDWAEAFVLDALRGIVRTIVRKVVKFLNDKYGHDWTPAYAMLEGVA